MVVSWLPDRPGALGAVAAGSARAGDVIGIDILETGWRPGRRRAGRPPAPGPAGGPAGQEIEQVDGVTGRVVRPVADAVHDPWLDGLERRPPWPGPTPPRTCSRRCAPTAAAGGRGVGRGDRPRRRRHPGRRRSRPSDAWLSAFVSGSQASAAQRQPLGERTSPGRRCPRPAWPWCSAEGTPSGPGSGGRSRPWPGSSTPVS